MSVTTLSFKVVKSFAVRQPNGKVHEFKKGRAVSHSTYLTLTRDLQANCKAIAPKVEKLPKRAKSIAWTRDELELVVNLYLEMVNPDGTYDATLLLARHAEVYPARDGQGVHQAAQQVRCYDTFVPQEGFTDISVEMLKVLADADPERFWTAVEVLLETLV